MTSKKLEFNIMRWDASTCTDDDHPKPMIYVKPNTDLLDYFRENNNKVWVRIVGTDSDYDDIVFYGIPEKASWRPNYTPNYYNATGQYVVTLDTHKWLGYPDAKGKAIFQVGIVNDQVDKSKRELERAVAQEPEGVCENVCTQLCELMGGEDCVNKCKDKCKDNLVIYFAIFIGLFVLIFYNQRP